MRAIVFLSALLLVTGLSITSLSGDIPIEKARAGAAAAFEASAVIPARAATPSLRCTARVRFDMPGYRSHCPFGWVVTGVEIKDNVALLSCGEIEVNCR
jgi:hypothetical protein